MISREDRRWLERSAGSQGRRLQHLLLGAAAFLAVVGTFNLGLALWIGGFEGYQAGELARGWISGFQLQHHYSGVYVEALGRITLGVLQLGVALYFAVKGRVADIERRRHQRLLAALKECGSR
jgi:hypothetical protein